MAVRQLSTGSPSGTTLGQSAADLIAFHGAAPVAQAVTIAAVVVTAVVATGGIGFSTSDALNTLVTAVNALITMAKNKGLIAAS